MNKLLTIVIVLGTGVSVSLAQTVIFSEDFESGSPSSDWGVFYEGEDALQAVEMSSAPATLDGGGNYVGYLQDSDASYTGIAVAIAGDTALQNYTIEADVYCYVNHSGGSAYTGLVVYADPSFEGSVSQGIYIKLVADFDADKRFRLYNNQFSMTTFSYTFHNAIDATGLYDTDAWHHMALKVETLDDESTSFTCYFDGQMIGDGEYVDSGADRVASGKFGIFSMQMDSDGIAAYFDNIVVTSNEPVSIDPDRELSVPVKFSLSQNHPNPFNASTQIPFQVDEAMNATLNIYNVNGELIRNLLQGYLVPKRYSIYWDGKDGFGKEVPSGVYIYTLKNGVQSDSKRMLLVK